MAYDKPALSVSEQVDRLLASGMVGDRTVMERRLSSVSYHRLSAYWHPFRLGTDTFTPGTSFDLVWQRYVFDRALRVLVMDVLERIEVAVRTRLANAWASAFGPMRYTEAANWGDQQRHQRFMEDLRKEVDRAADKEELLKRFFDEHRGAHTCPPVWMAAEVMSFGTVQTLYFGAVKSIRDEVADSFGVPTPVFESWLRALVGVRNICAHHGRLWNRMLWSRPMIPRRDRQQRHREWHEPVGVPAERVYAVLTICAFLLYGIAPGSQWAIRLRELVCRAEGVPVRDMGFPKAWESSEIWSRMLLGQTKAP